MGSKLGAGKVGIITQARMTSTRLPGKVLLSVAGKPLFAHHIERLKKTNLEIRLATTSKPTDDELVSLAKSLDLQVCRGSEDDVLSRYYSASHGLDVIVRVTADSPLIDAEIIKQAADFYLRGENPKLYLSNALERTYPRGFDFEIFSYSMLEEAFKNAKEAREREHVTPYFYLTAKDKMSFHHWKRKSDASVFRLTVDEADDFKLIQILMEKHQAHTLSGEDIISLMEAHPELAKINAHIEQKKIQDVVFRKAQMSDAQILWLWRNDPVTRQNSVNQDLVSLDNHLQWFEKSLASKEREIWIAYLGSDPIGTVRTDVKGSEIELSWTLAPNWRGRGLGRQMLVNFVKGKDKNFIARIRKDNSASIKIAERAGFKIAKEESEFIFFNLRD